MATGVKTDGHTKLLQQTRALKQNFPREVMSALFAEMQIERTESIRKTPRLTGALRASHMVLPPVQRGNDLSVTIAVGGVSAPYAIYVHEDLEAIHPIGQAKFLEQTLNESAPYMSSRIAKRIDLRRAMRT
jgi:hypothetical protein